MELLPHVRCRMSSIDETTQLTWLVGNNTIRLHNFFSKSAENMHTFGLGTISFVYAIQMFQSCESMLCKGPS